MTTISIHQPVYLPWLGFFKKILDCDYFVFLDDVQYEKNGYHNRNKIRTNEGWSWLTVPVKARFGMRLLDVPIDNQIKWSQKHKKTIETNYSKSLFFNDYWFSFKTIYDKKYDLLIDLNMEIIKYLLAQFKIPTRYTFSSTLNISESGSDKILKICKVLGANTYLSGPFGKQYLKEKDFVENKIMIKYQNFQHPVYRQSKKPFVSNMAAIDLLFNEGNNSENILQKSINF